MSIPSHKPNATEIVILGCGPSLDLARTADFQPTEERVVIALNVASALVEADYPAFTDRIAIAEWSPNAKKRPGQYAVVPRGMWRRYFEAGEPNPPPLLFPEPYVDGPHGAPGRLSFSNARSLGVGLSAALFAAHPGVKRVAYIGMDGGPVSVAGKEWVYAHRLRPFALNPTHRRLFSPHVRLPQEAYVIASKYATIRVYVNTLRARYPAWYDALDCRSFLDWRTGAIRRPIDRRGEQ